MRAGRGEGGGGVSYAVLCCAAPCSVALALLDSTRLSLRTKQHSNTYCILRRSLHSKLDERFEDPCTAILPCYDCATPAILRFYILRSCDPAMPFIHCPLPSPPPSANWIQVQVQVQGQGQVLGSTTHKPVVGGFA